MTPNDLPRRGAWLALTFAILMTPAVLCAQEPLRFVVRDSVTRAPLAGVQVLIAIDDLRLTRATAESGIAEFRGVPPGTYRLTVSRAGFESAIRERLVVEPGTFAEPWEILLRAKAFRPFTPTEQDPLPLLRLQQANPPRRTPLFRIEAGSLGPDDPFNVTLSYGATAGLALSDRDLILLRYVRQSQGGNTGTDVVGDARQLIAFGWERGLLRGRPLQRQFAVRLAAGILLRDSLHPGPAAAPALLLRYPMSSMLGLVGTVETALAYLPSQSVQICSSQNFGCTVQAGGRFQVNYGLTISLEIRNMKRPDPIIPVVERRTR